MVIGKKGENVKKIQRDTDSQVIMMVSEPSSFVPLRRRVSPLSLHLSRSHRFAVAPPSSKIQPIKRAPGHEWSSRASLRKPSRRSS